MIEYNTDSNVYINRAKILEEHGWTNLWHPDNWVRNEYFNHSTIDVDRAGVSMEDAWRIINFEQQQVQED
jgi:hypothetical protein